MDVSGSPHAQEQAYAFVKQRILSLEFGPGRRLRAQDIAAELNVSRTPIREALSRLEQEGLVTRGSGWGYVVKAFTLDEVVNLYKVRAALEAEAIREAITHVDEVTLRRLETVLDKAEAYLKRGSMREFQSTTRLFHEMTAQATRNPILCQMLALISDRIRIFSAHVMRQDRSRAKQICAENRKILKALKARDLTAAEAAVREHVGRASDSLVGFLQKAPNFSWQAVPRTSAFG